MKPSFRSRILTTAIAATLLLSAAAADAAPGAPPFIDYQGRVLDGNGTPLAPTTPANFEIEFRIYDAATGGTVIWAEKQLVTVLNGQFSVRLGEGQPIQAPAGGAELGTVQHSSPGLPGAFADSSRYLGITVKIPGQTAGEITPRLAFLASPFSYVSASAGKITQAPGTQSDLIVGSIAYATPQTFTSSAAISINTRTVLADAATATASNPLTATLPVSGAQREILVVKKDTTVNQVIVAPPAGGTINGASAPLRLKVRGESVTLQNVGGNDWWVVNDTRDKTPVGTIISYGAGSPPPGYLACDGAALLRTEHADLFAATGTAWGAPGGANGATFNAPWLSGRFLRGVDPTGAQDDDSTTRTALLSGGNIGRAVGSAQAESLKSHGHGVNDPGHNHSANPGSIAVRNFLTGNGGRGYNPDVADGYTTGGINAPGVNANTTGISIQNFGGNETRPDNANVLFCIKY